MGIKRLNKFLDTNGAIKKHENWEKYLQANHNQNIKVIAVDIMLYLYKYKSSYNDLIFGLTKQAMHFLKNKIVPVYVFDGLPIEQKLHIINNRKNRRENKEKKIRVLENEIKSGERSKEKIEELEKLKKSHINITYNDIKKAKQLLDILNIPYIQSFNEADISIARLYKEKKINCCLSEDMDILVFGCEYMIKLFKGCIYEYDLNHILSKLKLNLDDFITMCVLFGCDYLKPITKNNPNDIYEHMRNSVPVEEIVNQNNDKNINTAQYIADIQKTKEIFETKFKYSFSHNIKFSIKNQIDIVSLVNFLKNNFVNEKKKNSKKDNYINKNVIPDIIKINRMIKAIIY